MRKKVIIFFHGWDNKFEEKLKSQLILKKLFVMTYDMADGYCLLGNIFCEKLLSLGVSIRKTFFLPTVADDFFYKMFPPIERSYTSGDKRTILFLSRFDKNKGAGIVIKTFQHLQTLGLNHFRLLMVGDGPLLADCKRIIDRDKTTDIFFEGFVEGRRKHELLSEADILFLPSLSEGLPCVIMEGMLYGLAIVTRPIGAIPDWVQQNKNGWLSSSTDPKIFAEGILSLVSQPELMQSIKKINTTIAITHFTPESVKREMQFVHNSILKDRNDK